MDAEFCGHCGRRSRELDHFCRGCGTALGDAAAAVDPVGEAEALASQGRLSDAIASIQRGIGVADSAELRVALGALYARDSRLDDAAGAFDAALALDPDCAVAHAYLGALLVRRGRVADAEDALERARDLAPNDLLVSLKRAEYFNALGILERACDELRHGLTYGGGEAEVRAAAGKQLADLERRLGRSVRRHPGRLPHLPGLKAVLRIGSRERHRGVSAPEMEG